MPPDTIERASLPLKDAALLRTQCYVDGRWIDADDGKTMHVRFDNTQGFVQEQTGHKVE